MGEGSEIASGPSNIWSNMGRMGPDGMPPYSSESDSDGSQRQQLKVPNDKFRGLSLSKSLSETMEDKKIKRPQPVSKLQRQIDSDSDASGKE